MLLESIVEIPSIEPYKEQEGKYVDSKTFTLYLLARQEVKFENFNQRV
jgi:hypothetical protein